MKKILISSLFIIFNLILNAQTSVQVIVNVTPPYQQNIADYQLHPERILLRLVNTEAFDVNLQLGATLSSDNGVTLKTKAGFRSNQPIRIPASTSIDVDAFQIIQMFDLSNLEFVGLNRADFEKTGILPEGDYRLCIRAYNFRTLDPYSADEPIGCSNILPLYNLEPPIILNPFSEITIPALPVTNIVFNWTTPPGSPPNIQYKLRIVEVQGDRNPLDALVSNSVIPFFEQTINTNTYIYGVGQPQLIKGKKYAFVVNAYDPSNKIIFRNNGNSEIAWFLYGDNIIPPDDEVKKDDPKKQDDLPKDKPFVANESAVGNCGDFCKGILPVGAADNETIKVQDKIKIGSFELTITELNPLNSGKLSGKGTIPVPFINSSFAKLRVNFSDLSVNSEKKAISGTVRANVKSGSPNLVPVGQDETAKTLNHSISSISNIVNFIKNDPLQNVSNSVNQIGFELPLGIDSDPFLLAVTEVVFMPDQAYFSVVTEVDIPENNDNLGLTARNICMNGASDICGAMELYLSNDFNIDVLNLKLKAPTKGNNGKLNGTFMKLVKKDNNKIEVQDFNVLAEFTFPNKSLIDNQTKQALTTTFEFNANKGWANWTAQLTVPEFYVDGAEDIKFNLAGKTATYDHSDIANPDGLPSPYKSSDNSEPDIATNLKTWHGLYFPLITVKVPDIIKSSNDPNKGITVQARNLIFDKSGFTGVIEGLNIISIGNGSLAGWYASVDTVQLEFWKSTFKKNYISGKLVLPPSGSEINSKINQLDYRCLITNAKDKPMSYQFSVKPKNDMQFKAFYAKVNIANTSHIIIENRPKQNNPSETEIFAEAKLDGVLGIDDKLGKIPGILGVSLPELKFENLCVKTTAPYLNENAVFKFNSPQKTVAGFSINLKTTGFLFEPGAESKIGLTFKGGLNLISDGDAPFSLEAQTTFGIYAKIAMGANGRVSWEGVGGRLEDISLGSEVDLGALKLKGALKYYNREKESDCGFVGALSIKIPAVDVGIGMKAQFGSKGTGNSEYKYFSFEAMVDLGQTGIPMFLGVSLYGFGGGIYYNMKPTGALPSIASLQKAEANDNSGQTQKSALDLLNYSPTGQKYSPEKGAFALSATILFGLTSRNTLDADVTFLIAFNGSGGIAKMRLDGACRIVTDVAVPMPARNDNSLVLGKMGVEYDFENKIFDMSLDVQMKFPINSGSLLKVHGWLKFNVSPNGWYVHIGRPIPDQYCEINLLNIFTGKSYLEAGNYNIDAMPPIPQEIRNLAGIMANELPSVQGLPRGNNTAGFIHGAYQYFEAGGNFLFLYGHLKAGMGYDIAFKKYQDFSCEGISAAGANGWYATGQAYLGVNAKIGMDFGDWFGKAEIFEGGAVAAIIAGLPNPSWAKGAIAGYYNVFGGIFEGTFNFKFEIGKVCTPPNPLGVDFSLVAEISPADKSKDIEIIASPQVAFNFNVNKGNFTYKQVKDDGKTFDRYFQFNRNTIDITLQGGGKIYGNNFFKLALGANNTLIFESTDLLMPETQYTFTVKASILEAKTENGVYLPIIDKGKKLEEVYTYTFTTNRGFKTIPAQLMVNSYPLHSHKTYIDNEESNKFYFQFNKSLLPIYFDVPDRSTAKIFAVLFKGDFPIDNKLVTVNNLKWEFEKFNLEQSTEYRIEYVIKSAQNSGNGSSTKVLTDNRGGGIYKMQRGALSGISRGVSGAVVSYTHFTTSSYKTLEEKIASLSLNEITIHQGQLKHILNAGNSKEYNAEIIRKLPEKCPNNGINFYGERFISPDFEEYTSSSIFKNNVNTSLPPLFKYFNLFDYSRTNKFLSDISGIQNVNINLRGYVLCKNSSTENGFVIYCPSKHSFGESIVVPYTPPLYNFIDNKGINIFFNKNGIVNIPITYQIINLMFECPINVRPAIENPVQVIIDSRVNPAGYKGANNAQNWNSFNAGISGFGKSLNKNLVKGVAGKSFR